MSEEKMSKNVDMHQFNASGIAKGVPINNTEANQVSDDICDRLDQVFDLIFSSSKQVLGNIKSLGIRYGRSFDMPDHMLVLFPNEIYGFESWNNSQKKKLWKYHRSSQTISKNGVQVSEKNTQTFVEFVRQGLVALNDQKVMFSKNITKQEINKVK